MSLNMVKNKEVKLLEKKFHHFKQMRYFFPLANAYRYHNDLDTCISLFRQGLSVFPQYWAARVALGRALMEKGDLDGALEELEAASDQVPENLLLHRLLASIYFKRGDLSKAAACCRLVLFMISDDRECLFIMDEISKMQRRESQAEPVPEQEKNLFLEQAEPVPEEEKKLSPESWPSEREQEEQARKEPVQEEQAREDQSQEEILTPTIAELYLSQGFAEKALEIYQKLLIRQPDREEWLERIHFIQEEMGIKTGAKKAGGRGRSVEHGGKHGDVLQQLESWLKNIDRLKVN